MPPPGGIVIAAGTAARGHAAWTGAALLACSVAFQAVALWPELRWGQPAWNDTTFHIAAAERLGQSLVAGEPFLDPWVSEWSLGYPVWRTYQPLPHVVAAAWIHLTGAFVSPLAAFALLQYLLLAGLPISTYGSARLLGLAPLASGLASLLILAPAGSGDFLGYGIGYGAYVRNGSGLYTQLVAVHFLLLALGTLARALDHGRGRLTASILVTATALSHIVFGYVTFVSAALLALVGPRGECARRLLRLLGIVVPAVLLLAWFVVPMMLSAAEVNHSRWERGFKWASFGAPAILAALFSGALLDAGRPPVLTVCLSMATAAACSTLQAVVPRRLLALAAAWLLLFFGRATWGHLLLLVGVPADFHVHRLQAAFEVAAVLLTAWGLGHGLRAVAACGRTLRTMAALAVGAGLVLIGVERAGYLARNARDAATSAQAIDSERADLEQAIAAVREILAERPGRVAAGRRATWGDLFRVGDLPVYTFVSLAHLDQVSFLYHSMSLTSDAMELRDERSPVHDAAFGVRATIAPAAHPAPPHWRARGRFGRFVVYECSTQGYFGLADIGAVYTGTRSTWYEPGAAWLKHDWARAGVLVALDGVVTGGPALRRWQPLPSAPAVTSAPRGQIIEERRDGEVYRARLHAERACYVLIKLTWYPDLAVTVDGQPAAVVRVAPGFAAVPVTAGSHTVEARYAPGRLKPVLFAAGLVLFGITAVVARRQRVAGLEERTAARLARLGEPLASARATAALALLSLAAVALHPLFRGQLINGHDATAYPPRLVEFARALGDGHIPPVWAADLGNGFGQPLFQFAPPLLYLAAWPLYALGCRLTDALQIGLAGLCMAGAGAVYRLGRRSGASRSAALGGAAAWLFVPYLALDLYVRAAFAEAAAAAMAPVALLGVLAALARPTGRRVALGAAAVALLPLAHNAVALLMLPALAVVVAARRSVPAALTGAAVLGLGLGLAAFFWVPALLEVDFVKSELLREGDLHWRVHAISAWQLLWSPWGHGLSVPGPDDGMSFALGPVHLVLAVMGAAVAWRSNDAQHRRTATAGLAVAATGAWLATGASAVVWSHVETLHYLTHPWRTLVLPATFLPLLIVPALDRLGPRLRIVAIVALVAVNLPHTLPKGFLVFDEEYYEPASIAAKGMNTTTYEEYEPRWVGTRPRQTTERLRGEPPLGSVTALVLRTAHQEFAVTAEVSTAVEAATFYYPEWRVRVDGRELPITPAPERGTIAFHLPAGTHRVVLELEPTPLRRGATWLSLAVAGLLAGVGVGRHLRRASKG